MAAAAVLYSLIFNIECVKIVCLQGQTIQREFFISLTCDVKQFGNANLNYVFFSCEVAALQVLQSLVTENQVCLIM